MGILTAILSGHELGPYTLRSRAHVGEEILDTLRHQARMRCAELRPLSRRGDGHPLLEQPRHVCPSSRREVVPF